MIFRKIKYSFKRRFFKLLSILIGIIIIFVPFSASAVTVDYSSPDFDISAVGLFLVAPHGSTIPLNNFSTEFVYQDQTGSSFLTLTFSVPSEVVNSVYSLRYSLNITSDVEYGSNVSFSFINQIHTTDAYSVVQFPLYLTLDKSSSSLYALKQGDLQCYQGKLSLSSDSRSISNIISMPSDVYKDFTIYGDVLFSKTVSNASYISLTFKDISLKGGYTSPDGSSITDYENAESSLISGAQDDFTSVESQAQTSAMARIRHHLNAFQAVTAMFDGFILDSPDFSALLWISLSLSILAVLLGVAFSAASSFSRSKGRDDP